MLINNSYCSKGILNLAPNVVDELSVIFVQFELRRAGGFQNLVGTSLCAGRYLPPPEGNRVIRCLLKIGEDEFPNTHWRRRPFT